MVKRQPDPSDRRRHAISLTVAGKQMADELDAAASGLQQSFLGMLTPEERRTLLELLTRVVAANDDAGAHPSTDEPSWSRT